MSDDVKVEDEKLQRGRRWYAPMTDIERMEEIRRARQRRNKAAFEIPVEELLKNNTLTVDLDFFKDVCKILDAPIAAP